MMEDRSGKSALVTGATGFIGSHLCRRLVEDGWSVRALVREPARLAPALRARVEVRVGDICDENALRHAVREVPVIFHCAANVNTWDSREAYFATNVRGVEALLNAIARHNPGLARLVHVSTVDVYGFPEEPCDERCDTSATGFAYGDSKLAGETLVREYCAARRIPHTIIRPCNVIGPGSPFISRMGDELKSGLMVTIAGGRTNAGLVYVSNLADLLVWAAQSDKAVGESYNVRDAYDITWSEFIAAFRKAIGGKGLVMDLPFWAAEGGARVCEAVWPIVLPGREPLLHRLLVRIFGRTCGHSSEKIRRDAGLLGAVGFDEALEKSTQWFIERKHRQ